MRTSDCRRKWVSFEHWNYLRNSTWTWTLQRLLQCALNASVCPRRQIQLLHRRLYFHLLALWMSATPTIQQGHRSPIGQCQSTLHGPSFSLKTNSRVIVLARFVVLVLIKDLMVKLGLTKLQGLELEIL